MKLEHYNYHPPRKMGVQGTNGVLYRGEWLAVWRSGSVVRRMSKVAQR